MTAPTDALRAECERALAEFIAREIDAGDPTKKAADWFRAGFNVLAPEVKRLRAQLAQREVELKALSGHLDAVLAIIYGPDFQAAQSMAFVHGWQADPDRSHANSVALDAARAALANRPEVE